MTKIVVTGATSMIGLALTEYLLTHGHDVFAVCRAVSVPKLECLTNRNLHIVAIEMDEYGDLDKWIPEADVFVNLAWDGTNHEGRFLEDVHQANVRNSLVAIEAASRMGCQLFVEAGSQAEYGLVNEVITVDTPCYPFSDYGKAKLQMWRHGSKLSADLGIKYLHLRIFSVFGENEKPWTLIQSALHKMKAGEDVDLSDCDQMWNYLYVKDAVKQIALLCNYALSNLQYKSEIFHIASNDTRLLKDFVLEMKNITQSDSKLQFGAITPKYLVSLTPDISKTEKAIGFVGDYTFGEAIKNVLNFMNKN